MTKYALLLLAGILAGCSSVPSYTGPRTSEVPATIEKFGSVLNLCGLTVAFTKDPVCEARVALVDGQQASIWSSSIDVDPGERSLRLICSAVFSPYPGDTRWYLVDQTVTLEPGGKYRVEAVWDRHCRIRIVNATTGKVISGYSSSDLGRNRQSSPDQPVASGQILDDDFIQLRVPNTDGWRRIDTGAGKISLSRRGILQGETFGAQVILFGLEPTDSVAELTTLIKRGAEQDAPADRFSVLHSKFEANENRGYPCVRHDGVYEDRKARTSPNATGTLTLQVSALYCRYPGLTNIGFAAIYSHRGEVLHPTFASEAENFLEGVRVPSDAQPGGQPDPAHRAAQGRLP